MFTTTKSVYDVDYLDDQKQFIGNDCRVFRLKCIMLALNEEAWDKHPSVRTGSKSITDWFEIVREGKIIAWVNDVSYPFYMNSEPKSDILLEASCDVRSGELAYIKFIPDKYEYKTLDETGENELTEKRMAIEVGMEMCAKYYEGRMRYISYFYSEDTDEVRAFADELVQKCGIDSDVLDGFDWHGFAAETVTGFR